MAWYIVKHRDNFAFTFAVDKSFRLLNETKCKVERSSTDEQCSLNSYVNKVTLQCNSFIGKTCSCTTGQEITFFFITLNSAYCIHKFPQLIPVVSQLNLFPTLAPYLCKIRLNVILLPMPLCPK